MRPIDTTVSGSENLTRDKDSLSARFNALVAEDGVGYHLVSANHFLFQDIKAEKLKEQKEEDERDFHDLVRSIQRLSGKIAQGFKDIQNNISDLYNLAGDLLDDAERCRQLLEEAEEFRNGIVEALDNKDFQKDENGQYQNRALQQLIEQHKQNGGEEPEDMNALILLINNTVAHYDDEYIPALEKGIKRFEELSARVLAYAEQDEQDLKAMQEENTNIEEMEDSPEKEAAQKDLDQRQSRIQAEQQKVKTGVESKRAELKQQIHDKRRLTKSEDLEVSTVEDSFAIGLGINSSEDKLPLSNDPKPGGL